MRVPITVPMSPVMAVKISEFQLWRKARYFSFRFYVIGFLFLYPYGSSRCDMVT